MDRLKIQFTKIQSTKIKFTRKNFASGLFSNSPCGSFDRYALRTELFVSLAISRTCCRVVTIRANRLYILYNSLGISIKGDCNIVSLFYNESVLASSFASLYRKMAFDAVMSTCEITLFFRLKCP